ncbi:hypothetical protein GY45DRAFT_1070057 [Cubamyces sp. BRFM 1775]|nr:hypothetical protein GY45DRAFT_1070057 [Cubamyces sp. BRFM 1775]
MGTGCCHAMAERRGSGLSARAGCSRGVLDVWERHAAGWMDRVGQLARERRRLPRTRKRSRSVPAARAAHATPHHTAVHHPTSARSNLRSFAPLGRCWSRRQAYFGLDFENRELEGERGGMIQRDGEGHLPVLISVAETAALGRETPADGRRQARTLVTFAPMPSPVLAPRTCRCQCATRASTTRRVDLNRVHSFRDTASVYPPSPLPAASRVPTHAQPSPSRPDALMDHLISPASLTFFSALLPPPLNTTPSLTHALPTAKQPKEAARLIVFDRSRTVPGMRRKGRRGRAELGRRGAF